MSNVQPPNSPATQFKAEQWTTISGSGRELWATIMLDGADKGEPCAFGPKDEMKKYAQRLNVSKGKLREIEKSDNELERDRQRIAAAEQDARQAEADYAKWQPTRIPPNEK